MMSLTVGVLALQGGFSEHLDLLHKAADHLSSTDLATKTTFNLIEVRTPEQLARCNALIIPGGESTTISFVAAQSGLLEPLRDFVKVQKRPTWGTCAGLILLSDEANATKKGGQELIGGLGVRVHRNHFGRQIESFESNMDLPFLKDEPDPSPFPGVFIRAPVVEELLSTDDSRPPVHVLAKLPGRLDKMKPGVSQANTKDDSGDIVAVKQGNVLGMSFHPELTKDARIHVWWLKQILSQ
ncbi:PdxT/SNO family [Thelonectria olida]|uniref:glutaminase n=1 Tax=Thelonectria olida TaxID=1576542 RepID=A0A9P8WB12_9HYPO|nr:PdxT/SNO family [Thelonectria olida]